MEKSTNIICINITKVYQIEPKFLLPAKEQKYIENFLICSIISRIKVEDLEIIFKDKNQVDDKIAWGFVC